MRRQIVRTNFKAKLKKKKADGTIVYSDNRFLNSIYKLFYEKREGVLCLYEHMDWANTKLRTRHT